MPNSVNLSNHGKARRHSLIDSLKQVYWRPPRWFEWAVYVAVFAWNWFATAGNIVDCALGVALAFVVLRAHEFGDHYVHNRWPGDERKEEILSNIRIVALLLLFFSGFIKAFIKSLFSEPVETLKFVVIVFAFLVWCAPIMWMLDRVFKPWAARINDKILPALVFIVCCGLWFFLSIGSLLYFGGHLMA